MISALIVSYGTCIDSIPTIEKLVSSELVSEVLVIENKRGCILDWTPGRKENEAIKFVLGHKKLKVFESENNIGFGPAVQKLFLKARSQYALIINPDCIISENGLSELYEHMASCNCAVVSGCLIRPNKQIDAKNPSMNLFSTKSRMNCKRISKHFLRFTYFTGALALFDVSKLIKAGNYSSLFMYFDEIDTTKKLHKAGYEIHFIDKIVGTHSRGLTTLDNKSKKSDFTAYWSTNSSIKFTRIHNPQFLPFVYIARFLWAVILFLKGQRRAALAVWEGIKQSKCPTNYNQGTL